MSELFNRGDQVAYVPNHAGKDMSHPDVEYGFVTSMHDSGEIAFVRYWRQGSPGELRTTSCSEGTGVDCLYSCVSVPQSKVTATLHWIDEQDKIDFAYWTKENN